MPSTEQNVRDDIERLLDRGAAGWIEVHFDGGVVKVRTDDMRWWRNTKAEDVRSMADRLALVLEDPTMILGVTHTGDWQRESEARRARRHIEITMSESLRLESGPRPDRSGQMASSVGLTVDVLMPLKHGTFVRGDVIKGLLTQDRPVRLYIEAGPDLPVTSEQIDLFAPATPGLYWRLHVFRLLKILAKRNRLSKKGSSPLVYLADSDVRVPPQVFGGMADALVRNPHLGATGLSYQIDFPHKDAHVFAGSMMIRREDLTAIGPLRGSPCECSYIRNRLAEQGKVVVAVECVHAHQWKRTLLDDTRVEGERNEEEMRPEDPCPRCGQDRNAVPTEAYVDIRMRPEKDGSLSSEKLTDVLREHDDRFRLFVDSE